MLKISRLDYKNRTERKGLYQLNPLTDLREITDVNEVSCITIEFNTYEQAIEFQSKFPKSYKAKIAIIGHYDSATKQGHSTYDVYFRFDTFWSNATTGEINETAVKNRVKVIKKLTEIV